MALAEVGLTTIRLRIGAMKLAQAIGNGLVAGAAGTAAMTLTSTLEMKLRGREPSTVPTRAAATVLGSSR